MYVLMLTKLWYAYARLATCRVAYYERFSRKLGQKRLDVTVVVGENERFQQLRSVLKKAIPVSLAPQPNKQNSCQGIARRNLFIAKKPGFNLS